MGGKIGHAPPLPWAFATRNRIIAALAKVLVVIEAVNDTGCLFTAGVANQLGGELAAVSGRIADLPAHGAKLLLRDEAHPILDVRDILDLLLTAH